MSQQPLVSIIMPVYNAGQFIGETIQTILKQTYKNWELVIVDDDSTDNTKEVVDALKLPKERLQYHVSKSNKGPGAARNYGINKANGTLIAFLDGDDLWQPEKLAKQVAIMQEQDCDFVLSSGVFMGAPKDAVFATAKGRFEADEMFTLLYKHNRIPLVSAITKKTLIVKAGGFKEEGLLSRKAEDYYLWMKLAKNGAVFYGLEDSLVIYRIHADSVTGQTTTMLEADLQAVTQFDDYMKKHNPKLRHDRLKLIYDRLAASYAYDGNQIKAKNALNDLKEYQSPWVVQFKSIALGLLGKYYGKLYHRFMY